MIFKARIEETLVREVFIEANNRDEAIDFVFDVADAIHLDVLRDYKDGEASVIESKIDPKRISFGAEIWSKDEDGEPVMRKAGLS